MSVYVGYQHATGCTGSTTGARALMAWYLGAYANRTNPQPANLGIYVCKSLGSGWSIHAEGRAADLGTSPYRKPPWGWNLANALKAHSAELGIQCIIFDRKIWSGAYPHAGWRNYTGSDPHGGHLHVELTRTAARTLTTRKIEHVLGGGSTGGDGGGSPPGTTWARKVIRAMKTINLSKVTNSSGTWVRGADVRRLQGLLLADGYGPDGLTGRNRRPDGIAGPATRRALGAAQEKHNSGRPSAPGRPDYVAGKNTWAALAGVKL